MLKMIQNSIKSYIPAIIITILLLVLECFFLFVLEKSQIIPTKYIALVAVVIFLFIFLLFFFMHRKERKGRFIVGTLFSFLLSVILIYGIIGVHKVTGTLKAITDVKTEMTDVGVYVLTDNLAESLEELDEENFGVLEELERETTNNVIEQIKSQDISMILRDYSGPTTLIEGLRNGETGAIILSTAYIDVIKDLDGYEEIDSEIRKIASFSVEGESKTPTEKTIDKDVFTIYISGIDSREGLIAKGRCDVNILATVNMITHQILLVTTPRDYFVELPISYGARDKLTHAGIYGINVSMGTLSMLFGLEEIDYYFRICFEGMRDLVDAVGGVTAYSDYTFTTKSGAYSFVEGYNEMNGKEALAFSRERYAFLEGDRQRGKNQTAVIKAMLDKVTSPDILANYSSILEAVEGNFETSFSYDQITGLANEQLDSAASWEVISYSVDGYGSTEIPYSMSMPVYVMIPDETTVTTAQTMIQSMMNGERITEPTKTEAIID
ncbi:MAG: LCP family protein [Lactovum sp.]